MKKNIYNQILEKCQMHYRNEQDEIEKKEEDEDKDEKDEEEKKEDNPEKQIQEAFFAINYKY
jgi:hypothetical protein